MSNLPEKIHSATQELRRLQEDIQTSTPAPSLAEVDSGAVREFKAAIDYVRQLLWNYIQADTAQGGQSVDEEVRSLRLQRVTEMLQAIQQEVKVRKLTPTPATVTFLNAVQEIADAAFDRHSGSGTEVEKAS
jgi:septation ring formation regulator EzrA